MSYAFGSYSSPLPKSTLTARSGSSVPVNATGSGNPETIYFK